MEQENHGSNQLTQVHLTNCH